MMTRDLWAQTDRRYIRVCVCVLMCVLYVCVCVDVEEIYQDRARCLALV